MITDDSISTNPMTAATAHFILQRIQPQIISFHFLPRDAL